MQTTHPASSTCIVIADLLCLDELCSQPGWFVCADCILEHHVGQLSLRVVCFDFVQQPDAVQVPVSEGNDIR
jgi:hypothetical protein